MSIDNPSDALKLFPEINSYVVLAACFYSVINDGESINSIDPNVNILSYS